MKNTRKDLTDHLLIESYKETKEIWISKSDMQLLVGDIEQVTGHPVVKPKTYYGIKLNVYEDMPIEKYLYMSPKFKYEQSKFKAKVRYATAEFKYRQAHYQKVMEHTIIEKKHDHLKDYAREKIYKAHGFNTTPPPSTFDFHNASNLREDWNIDDIIKEFYSDLD